MLVPLNQTRRWLCRGVIVALVAFYLATRLVNLTLLPIFIDEATQIRWAGDLLVPSRLREPIFYGKFLQPALTISLLSLLSEPLLALRSVSVIAGLATLGGTYLLARRLYSPLVGLVASLLYIVSLFNLFYDRMGLADGLQATWSIWVLLFSLEAVQSRCREHPLALGVALGAGILTKASGLFLFLTPPLVALFYGHKSSWRALLRQGAMAYAVAFAMLAPLVLVSLIPSPTTGRSLLWASAELEKNALGAASDHFALVAWNLELAASWLIDYWGWPLILAAGAAFVIGLKYRDQRALLLGLLALFPTAVYVLIAGGWWPRYLVFTTIPVLILAAHFIVGAARKIVVGLASQQQWSAWLAMLGRGVLVTVGLLAVAMPWLNTGYWLLRDPIQAPLPMTDRILFVEGWPAGYGIREATTFLQDEARRRGEPVTAVRHCCRISSLLDGLAIYLHRRPDVRLVTLNLYLSDEIARLKDLAARQTFYYVSNEPQEPHLAVSPAKFGIESKLVWVYHKPGQRSRIEIYVVNP